MRFRNCNMRRINSHYLKTPYVSYERKDFYHISSFCDKQLLYDWRQVLSLLDLQAIEHRKRSLCSIEYTTEVCFCLRSTWLRNTPCELLFKHPLLELPHELKESYLLMNWHLKLRNVGLEWKEPNRLLELKELQLLR